MASTVTTATATDASAKEVKLTLGATGGAGGGAGAGSAASAESGISNVGMTVHGVECSTEPLLVPMTLHAENRARLLARFKSGGDGGSAEAVPSQSVILMEGGKATTRDDTDHEPLFRQESNFQWMFGVKEPDCYGAVDIETGRTTVFIPRLPAEYAIWMGHIDTPDEVKAMYDVDEVKFCDELTSFMEKQDPGCVYVFQGLNTDSGNYAKPASFKGLEAFRVDNGRLFEAVVDCRVIKTEAELQVLRYNNLVSSEAHIAVMANIKPGLREYQMESLFRHWCYYYGGARNMSYTCICGSGKNGAILHYGHAGAPNAKLIKDGDMCLFDMGGEYHCYASDITCSFPANGKFTDDQKLIYEAVLAATWAVEGAIKPGVNYLQMHELAYRTALTKLKEGGLLVGDVDEMMAVNLGSVLMPHGLGHFLGLDTHDVGGYPKGTKRDTRAGFKSLRTVRTLKAGMVLTVEPGIYFNDCLLDPALENAATAKFFNTDMLKRFRGFGGVRIEDDIVVTETGIELMTHVPRTVAEIEAVMAGKITKREDVSKKF